MSHQQDVATRRDIQCVRKAIFNTEGSFTIIPGTHALRLVSIFERDEFKHFKYSILKSDERRR